MEVKRDFTIYREIEKENMDYLTPRVIWLRLIIYFKYILYLK